MSHQPSEPGIRSSRRLFAAILAVGFLLAGLAYILTNIPTARPSNGPETPSPGVEAALEQAPTAEPIPAGSSRSNPIPRSDEPISVSQWQIRILDTMRGDEAWQRIREANMFNEPPGEGREYLLVQLWIRREDEGDKRNTLLLHVTGNRLITHFSFDAGVVPPEPRLETFLPGESESEGWIAYRIFEDEGDLQLLIKDAFDFENPTIFAALAENAAIDTSTNAVESIVITDEGVDPEQPAIFGNLVTGEDWQLKVTSIVQGKQAWKTLYEANQFNDPPGAGMEYVIVELQVGYIGRDADGVFISDSRFSLHTESGEFFETASVVDPEPELFYELFPGGVASGLITFLVPKASEPWVLVFDPEPYSGYSGNRRYLSLATQGR